MKLRILPYIGLCIVSLVVAYFASQYEDSTKSGLVSWQEIRKNSITRVEFALEKAKGKISLAEGYELYWVEVDDGANPQEGGGKSQKFLASDAIKSVLDGFTPFRVKTVVGQADRLKLAEFGLEKPSGTVEVHYENNKSFKLLIGKQSFQSPEVFVLDPAKNMVLLVERNFISILDNPRARLRRTQPYVLKAENVEKVHVAIGESKIEYLRQVKGESDFWYRSNKAANPDETFRNWLDKVLKLRIEDYATAEESAQLNKKTRVLSLELSDNRKSLDTWEIFESGAAAPKKYFLKTKSLPDVIILDASKLEPILKDVSALAAS